jgi:hypothetical protein
MMAAAFNDLLAFNDDRLVGVAAHEFVPRVDVTQGMQRGV